MQKSLRLTALALSMLLASTASFAHNYKGEGSFKGEAQPAPAMPCATKILKDGWYVGLQGGYDAYRDHANDTGDAGFDTYLSSTGFVGGIFGGYGMNFSNSLYLGAELSANYSDANSSNFGGVLKTNVYSSYGISIIPGVALNDSSRLYVRLGYESARINQKLTTASSHSDWMAGYQAGLGLETALTESLSLRGEYNYADLGSKTYSDTGIRHHMTDSQFMLGLGYHFA